MILQAREISRTFRTGRTSGAVLTAVDSVSLDLPRASITSLVGESGSGKSTLARVMARLMPASSGQLLLDGQVIPASQRRRRDYASDVQMILQDPCASLNPVHDVRYHLSRPLRIHHAASHDDDQITELLERVALTPGGQFIDKYPHELSGGQRQRVAIARALAVRPRILLADEPVSMLDVSIRLGVLNLLADLREKEALTILYITHDIASARYLADQVAVMYRGQIVESGPAIEVSDNPAHPYTQLLLSAAPDPGRTPGLSGQPRPGTLPVPGTGPTAEIGPVPDAAPVPGAAARQVAAPGCQFRQRCPHAMPLCAEATPPRAGGGGRRGAPPAAGAGPGPPPGGGGAGRRARQPVLAASGRPRSQRTRAAAGRRTHGHGPGLAP